MDHRIKNYLQRSENENSLAEMILKLSINKKIQITIFNMETEDTYFSAVITHAYYSIFYGAKAYLLTKGISTKSPNEHKRTLKEFEKLALSGEIDMKLLMIYKSIITKADDLLNIFKKEKDKRGNFTYRRIPQANQKPAEESLENASYFFKHIFDLCNN